MFEFSCDSGYLQCTPNFKPLYCDLVLSLGTSLLESFSVFFLRVCFTLSFSCSLHTGTSGSSLFMLSTLCLVEEVEVKGCFHCPWPTLVLDRLCVPVVELFQWFCLFPRSRPLLSPRVGFFHFPSYSHNASGLVSWQQQTLLPFLQQLKVFIP